MFSVQYQKNFFKTVPLPSTLLSFYLFVCMYDCFPNMLFFSRYIHQVNWFSFPRIFIFRRTNEEEKHINNDLPSAAAAAVELFAGHDDEGDEEA